MGLGLSGEVANNFVGVRIEVQGPGESIDAFVAALRALPPPVVVESLEFAALPLRPERGFRVVASEAGGPRRPSLPPDLAVCDACLAEVFDPNNRRYRYPFTCCTACGPRYTLALALPFDRERTAMARFPMCAACQAEHDDPADRRYCAQVSACPACGPTLRWGELRGEAALSAARAAIAAGAVIGVLGVGGWQLICDAADEAAVARLRALKRRPDKPLAVMVPDRAALCALAEPCAGEEALWSGPDAPIALMRPRADHGLAPSALRGAALVGLMRPPTPLHALLLDRPVVASSGNVGDEPLCFEIRDAEERLNPMVFGLLGHDRPVLRPADDGVVRWAAGRRLTLRRARGSPAALPIQGGGPAVLAFGGHQKATVALAFDDQVALSPHIGELDGPLARDRLGDAALELCRFYGVEPERVACDLHPDYGGTRLAESFAAERGLPLVRVQHHHAHAAAVAAEHGVSGPALALCWDGAGLGTDGAIWGSEALLLDGANWTRVAHLRPFRLPFGSSRDPSRSAAGLLHAAPELGEAPRISPLLRQALDRGVGAMCTSMGRLFDGVAALLGLGAPCTFEAQAAARLEAAAARGARAGAYPLPLGADGQGDWAITLRALLHDGDPIADRALRFHGALASFAAEIVERHPMPTILLAGGCFQNAALLEAVVAALGSRRVLWPSALPPNDGALAVGQAMVARRSG